MDRGFYVVIGMTIAYAASFCGMIFAYISYKRKMREREAGAEPDKKGAK